MGGAGRRSVEFHVGVLRGANGKKKRCILELGINKIAKERHRLALNRASATIEIIL